MSNATIETLVDNSLSIEEIMFVIDYEHMLPNWARESLRKGWMPMEEAFNILSEINLEYEKAVDLEIQAWVLEHFDVLNERQQQNYADGTLTPIDAMTTIKWIISHS